LICSKEEFNEIADNSPELHEDISMHPDIEYFKSGIFKDIVDKESKTNDISKQKKLFISSLKQEISVIIIDDTDFPDEKEKVQ
jgi:hypothetical protein